MTGPLLVVSAHAADFVWRCGGYIAKTTSAGGRAEVICLTYGERSESADAWKKPDMTVERVKEIRRGEAEAAGKILGARMTFLEAMAQLGTQGHLVGYYTDLGDRRGNQAVRNGGSGSIRQAEAYQREFPQVVEVLA